MTAWDHGSIIRNVKLRDWAPLTSIQRHRLQLLRHCQHIFQKWLTLTLKDINFFFFTHCQWCWSCGPGNHYPGWPRLPAWKPPCALSSGCQNSRWWGQGWGCSGLWCCLHCWDSGRPGWDPGKRTCTSMWPRGAAGPSSGSRKWASPAGRGWRCTSWWGPGRGWPSQTLEEVEGFKMRPTMWRVDDSASEWERVTEWSISSRLVSVRLAVMTHPCFFLTHIAAVNNAGFVKMAPQQWLTSSLQGVVF